MKITQIHFSSNLKKYLIVSGAFMLAIVIGLFVNGVELDITFKGGSIITYSYEGDLSVDDFTQKLDGITATKISLQESVNLATGKNTLVVSLPGDKSLTAEEMARVNEETIAAFPANNIEVAAISNVDPSMGREFLAKCLVAVLLASILMMVYVALRFRKIGGLSAGAMGVVALIHDVIIAFGVFVLFRIPLNDNFFAVLLTILGYSLNDTIVIYDRIRENRRLTDRARGEDTALGKLVDLSINQSFKRTMMTSITTALAMIVVAVVAMLFNVTSIISFAFPMIIGLASGNYSSICLASPLWVKWQDRKAAKAA